MIISVRGRGQMRNNPCSIKFMQIPLLMFSGQSVFNCWFGLAISNFIFQEPFSFKFCHCYLCFSCFLFKVRIDWSIDDIWWCNGLLYFSHTHAFSNALAIVYYSYSILYQWLDELINPDFFFGRNLSVLHCNNLTEMSWRCNFGEAALCCDREGFW